MIGDIGMVNFTIIEDIGMVNCKNNGDIGMVNCTMIGNIGMVNGTMIGDIGMVNRTMIRNIGMVNCTMIGNIGMVNSTMILNPKFLSAGFQMLSKNVYINVFVHNAFDKMKTSHFFDDAMHTHTITVPLPHLTVGRRFFPKFFFRFSPYMCQSVLSKYIIFVGFNR
jgi:hypothetical protein